MPDPFMREIRLNQKARIQVDSYPGTVFHGKVTRLDAAADPISRTFTVEIRVPNPGEKLRPGQIARATVLLSGKKDMGLYVPLDSVMNLGSDPHVFIVREDTALRRNVKTGQISGVQIDILEGLRPGENVVITGQEYIKDGQTVIIDTPER